MTRRPRALALACATAALCACAKRVERAESAAAPGPLVVDVVGADGGRGNVVGVQPWLTPRDYASAGALAAKLRAYMEIARGRGFLRERTLVVFPEYAGTWLVAAGEGEGVVGAATLDDAMTALALAHPARFAAQAWAAPAQDRLAYAAFATRGPAMAAAYESVFAGIARDFGVDVVAGSIVLPAPRVVDGHIAIEDGGALENVSALFHSGGRVDDTLVRKAFPTADELPFTQPAGAAPPVFASAAGDVGVAICADAWFPQTHAALARAPLVVVPVFITGDWSKRWGGYSGWPMPADVDARDVGAISERDAWLKYAVARQASSPATTVMLVPLRGALWNLADDGAIVVVAGGEVRVEPSGDGPALVNLWL